MQRYKIFLTSHSQILYFYTTFGCVMSVLQRRSYSLFNDTITIFTYIRQPNLIILYHIWLVYVIREVFPFLNLLLVGDNDGDMSEIELAVRQQKKLNLIKMPPTITAHQKSENQFNLVRAIYTPDELNLTIYD